jgi:hypothetical protein
VLKPTPWQRIQNCFVSNGINDAHYLKRRRRTFVPIDLPTCLVQAVRSRCNPDSTALPLTSFTVVVYGEPTIPQVLCVILSSAERYPLDKVHYPQQITINWKAAPAAPYITSHHHHSD